MHSMIIELSKEPVLKQERISEAVKQGFVRIVVPYDNAPRKKVQGVEIIPVKRVSDLLSINN